MANDIFKQNYNFTMSKVNEIFGRCLELKITQDKDSL